MARLNLPFYQRRKDRALKQEWPPCAECGHHYLAHHEEGECLHSACQVRVQGSHDVSYASLCSGYKPAVPMMAA